MTAIPSTVPMRLVSGKGAMRFDAVDVSDGVRSVGATPAVVLDRPLYARNLATCVRACTAWGVSQLWWTDDRLQAEILGSRRLPREERMKAYSSVSLMNHDRPLDFFPEGVEPVCVELVKGAVPLHHFTHPEKAVYVFGPEDGGVGKGLRHCCHHFLVLPTHHCLNLAAAVNVVLAHRRVQRIGDGREEDRLSDWLDERRGPMYSMNEEG